MIDGPDITQQHGSTMQTDAGGQWMILISQVKLILGLYQLQCRMTCLHPEFPLWMWTGPEGEHGIAYHVRDNTLMSFHRRKDGMIIFVHQFTQGLGIHLF